MPPLPHSQARKKKREKRCEHNRRSCQCRECGGPAICSHGKNKYFCSDCPGNKCEHGYAARNCSRCRPRTKALAEGAKAAAAANVVRTFPACNLYHALSPSGSGERWGDLQQPAPPSFLQQPLPPRKLPPPPPSSFKPLQWRDADASGTRWDDKALGHAAGVLCLAAAKRALHGP
jgi:hypothetical protein